MSAQLTVTGGFTAAQLANTLTGPGVTISNISMLSPGASSGKFNGTASNIGIASGVLLTSGDIANAPGPNLSTSITTDNSAAGDVDLTTLAGVVTNDACTLSFDLVAACDTIQIAYVFGSDEYPEWVGSFNDAFAFFISGPGIPGGTQNIALIPGTTTPVTINNVNAASNAAYYVDNTGGASVEYDGFTVPLIAIAAVIPCSTYHIKLAIADAVDWAYDSGVFLQEGGIRCFSSQINISAKTATTSGGNVAIEDCVDGIFNFIRSGDLSSSLTLHYQILGTAINGVDYAPLPTSITFAPGVDSIALVIAPQDDGLSEGLESVWIIMNDTVCNFVFSDTATIIISDPPIAQFNATAVCQSDPTVFTNVSSFVGGALVGWTWDFEDGNTSSAQNPQHIYASHGTFNVMLVVETVDGCTDTIVNPVTVHPLPVLDFSFSGQCVGHPTFFTDLSTIVSPDNVVSWNWDFGDGNVSSNQNPSYIYASPGIYNVTLVATSSKGCTDAITIPVEIFASPLPDFSITEVCEGEPTSFIDLSGIVAGVITDWLWDFGDGASSTDQNPVHTYMAHGTYDVQLILTSDMGCVDSISIEAIVNPLPIVDFESNITCFFDTTYFQDLTTIPYGNLTNWQWDFGDGDNSIVQNPKHVYMAPGFYPVTLTVTSAKGCITIFTKDAEVTPPPISPTVFWDTVCVGYEAHLAATAPQGVTLNWFYEKDNEIPFMTGGLYTTPPVFGVQVYWVEAVTDRGCKSKKYQVRAYKYRTIQAGINVSSNELDIPNAIAEFSLQVNNQIVSYLWKFGDGTQSTLPAPVHEYTEPGVYEVLVYLVDEFGCEKTVNYHTVMQIEEKVRLLIPNAFTPNGDGLNDYFTIGHRLITEVNIQILDRWGRLVFESRDMDFSWDGKDISGQDLPEGVYMFNVQAKVYNGLQLKKSGSITLIR